MTRGASQVALCSAIEINAGGGEVPEWVHLLPAGPIRTLDGRGPYRVASMQAIARMLPAGSKLPIDENHATDKGGKALGMPAPARGWIVALQARDSGLWGKVEWTGEGRRLMLDRAYCGISPVILHSKAGQVMQVLRASLTNTPNLQGLTALHSQSASSRGAALDDTDQLVISLFGISEDEYRSELAAIEMKREFL